jgi:outer membrane biosynthesis protein TonB
MSREHELYKDKIEVSLDGRQIFYLFFGGAVIVGLVFVLGVMVGRRVEARGHIERAHVEAAVDPLAALDRLEGGTGLSFQGSLRGAEPAQQPEVDKKIAEIAKAKEPEKKPEKKAAAEPKPEPKAEPKLEPKAEVKPEKKDEVAKKDEPKPESKPEAKPEPKPEKKDPKFTLQLSSFQDKSEAESYVASIKSSGFSPYITEGSVDGKQYFRVRLGKYGSVDAANDAKADFEKASKKSALVTKL